MGMSPCYPGFSGEFRAKKHVLHLQSEPHDVPLGGANQSRTYKSAISYACPYTSSKRPSNFVRSRRGRPCAGRCPTVQSVLVVNSATMAGSGVAVTEATLPYCDK